MALGYVDILLYCSLGPEVKASSYSKTDECACTTS